MNGPTETALGYQQPRSSVLPHLTPAHRTSGPLRPLDRRRPDLTWLLPLLLALLTAPALRADVSNYPFDRDLDRDGRPDLWRNITRPTDGFWPDPPAARIINHENRKAVKLVLARGKKGVEYHNPIPLRPDKHYALAGELATSGLKNGGAVIEAILLDDKGGVLATRRSPPHRSGPWKTIEMPLSPLPNGTRWMRLRCLLLGKGDARGEAYFAPIQLFATPRRMIHTPWATVGRFHPLRRLRASGAISGNVRVALRISGAKPSDYTIRLSLSGPSKRGITAAAPWQLSKGYGTGWVDITLRETGFYSGTVQLMRGKQFIFAQPLELAIYSRNGAQMWRAPGPIGLALHDIDSHPSWVPAATLLRFGKIRFPVDLTRQPPPPKSLMTVLRRLEEQQLDPLAMLVGKDLVAGLLTGKKTSLMQLDSALRLYGENVTQWQLGGDADGPAWQQDTARAAFLRKLKGIAQAANVNATFGLPDTSGAGFQVQSSPLGRASARDIVIHHIAARKLGRRVDKQKLTRLSRLLIDRQIDGVGGLLLARPPSERWFAADRAHPELLLARSINSFLGPAPHLTTISESVQVFQHQGKTVFAVWHDLNTKPVELYPGRDAQAWDLLGNPIPLGGPGNQITKSTYKIMAAVSREPYFVTGVDTPWLNTQLSARWTPATVASQSGEQKLTLQITNHFPERRRFVFRFRLPDGIKTSAREHSLVLESGQQGSLKIKINVYTSAYAGVSQAELFTHVLKDDESRFFRRLIPLEVQSVLGVKAQVKGRSLLISATNTTGETLNLAMRVQLSGGLREAWAIDFPPNSTRSRELAVDNAAELVGQKVEISLRDSSSGRFLRTQVVVE